MSPKTISRAAALTSLALAGAAGAHITFADPGADPGAKAGAKAGAYYAGFLRVSHGCAGSPTVSIRVAIPDSVSSARPQPKPGWTLSVEKAPLPKPVRAEGGGEVRDRVTAITWTGRLEADQFDQFGIMLKLPDATGPLYFPTVQRCAAGRTEWTTIPAPGQPWHSVDHPAPVLEVSAGGGDAMRM